MFYCRNFNSGTEVGVGAWFFKGARLSVVEGVVPKSLS